MGKIETLKKYCSKLGLEVVELNSTRILVSDKGWNDSKIQTARADLRELGFKCIGIEKDIKYNSVTMLLKRTV